VNEEINKFIKLFKALANEERIAIIQLLKKNGEMFAQDVEKHFFLEQSTTSHHLNTLKRAGITSARKEGRKIFYSINKESFAKIWQDFYNLIFEE
jgi:DNA-binding transcriptional ArsR family regulator